jgi:hypothetical protein
VVVDGATATSHAFESSCEPCDYDRRAGNWICEGCGKDGDSNIGPDYLPPRLPPLMRFRCTIGCDLAVIVGTQIVLQIVLQEADAHASTVCYVHQRLTKWHVQSPLHRHGPAVSPPLTPNLSNGKARFSFGEHFHYSLYAEKTRFGPKAAGLERAACASVEQCFGSKEPGRLGAKLKNEKLK